MKDESIYLLYSCPNLEQRFSTEDFVVSNTLNSVAVLTCPCGRRHRFTREMEMKPGPWKHTATE